MSVELFMHEPPPQFEKTAHQNTISKLYATRYCNIPLVTPPPPPPPGVTVVIRGVIFEATAKTLPRQTKTNHRQKPKMVTK
jgi:hypothetical protein